MRCIPRSYDIIPVLVSRSRIRTGVAFKGIDPVVVADLVFVAVGAIPFMEVDEVGGDEVGEKGGSRGDWP